VPEKPFTHQESKKTENPPLSQALKPKENYQQKNIKEKRDARISRKSRVYSCCKETQFWSPNWLSNLLASFQLPQIF
jgi:hypothetical protein